MDTSSDAKWTAFSEAWWHGVTRDLEAYGEEQRRRWGDLDEEMLGRFVDGECTQAERLRVERAVRELPAVREFVTILQSVIAEEQPGTPLTEQQPKTPRISRRWIIPRKAIGIASGIVAVLVTGFFFQQLANTGRQIARLRGDNNRLAHANADLEQRINSASQALYESMPPRLYVPPVSPTIPDNPLWPPKNFLLTGQSQDNKYIPSDSFDFVAWLSLRDDEVYGGFWLPISQKTLTPKPIQIECKLIKLNHLIITSTKFILEWPDLTIPKDSVDDAPFSLIPNSVDIDIAKSSFTGTIRGQTVRGKVTY